MCILYFDSYTSVSRYNWNIAWGLFINMKDDVFSRIKPSVMAIEREITRSRGRSNWHGM